MRPIVQLERFEVIIINIESLSSDFQGALEAPRADVRYRLWGYPAIMTRKNIKISSMRHCRVCKTPTHVGQNILVLK